MKYLITNRREWFSSYKLWDTFMDLGEAIAQIKAAQNKNKWLILDTETSGLSCIDDTLRCIQIGTGVDEYIFDLEVSPYDLWEPMEAEVLRDILHLKPTIFIGHNLSFDQEFLLEQRIIVKEIFDTYLASQILHNGFVDVRHNLAVVQERYLGYTEMDKEQRKKVITHGLNDRENIIYSARDVDNNMLILAKKLRQELIKYNMLAAHQLECKYSIAHAYLAWSGIYVDVDIVSSEYEKMIHKKVATATTLMDSIKEHESVYSTFFDMNLESGDEVIQLLQALGLNTFDDREGKHSSAAPFLRKMAKDNIVVANYLKYRKAADAISKFGNKWLFYRSPSTKRVHTKYRQLGTETGRLACGGKRGKTPTGLRKMISEFNDFPNTLNIPKPVRHCFTAQGANTLVVLDYSNMEVYVTADRAVEAAMIEALKGGKDLHCYAASLSYNKPYEDIVASKHKDDRGEPLSDEDKLNLVLRQNSKGAGFAILFGGDGNTIANNLNISVADGKAAMTDYLKAFPHLNAYFEKQEAFVNRNGYIQVSNFTGRRRYIYGWAEHKRWYKNFDWDTYKREKAKKTDKYKEMAKEVRENMNIKSNMSKWSKNTPSQGGAAEIAKTACTYFFDWLIKENLVFKVRVPIFVYDEIGVECSPSKAKKVEAALKACMETASGKFLTHFDKIPVSGKITKHWTH